MTSHLSIADGRGQVVSMTTTINQNFGARIAVGGFYLNNVLTNFAPNPMENGKPSINRMAPSKRPRTSIAPIIVLDRDGPLAAIGAGGGEGAARGGPNPPARRLGNRAVPFAASRRPWRPRRPL
jgi:gamma-glutamyltranspeptidase/glutathione hydrolase